MSSRKTILTIVAVVGTIITALGFSANAGAALGGLAAVLVYVFLEAKADIATVRAQSGKWKDPKWIITLISAIVAALQTSGVTLPIDANIIISVLTVIVGILFKTVPSVRTA